MCAKPNLDDAKACLARAQRHYRELNELAGPDKLWGFTEGQDGDTGEWFNCLHLDRGRLVAAKPVLADSATNAISALDHVAAAIAKANGHDRLRWLHYPLGLTDDDFNEACGKTKDALGDAMLGVLANARQAHPVERHHIEAARQISNDGKHWGFRPADGKAAAIQLVVPGNGHKVFDLPADAFAAADAHEFYRGQERLPKGDYLIVVNLLVSGLDDGLPDAANSILECSFRFVRGVIDAVAAAGAGEDDHTA
ncbi:hypothetical protein U8326_10020 [Tsuneonella sp. CC-YZS046]|uniref:hypothetical protein n=1 Tax=Tsuneonella sp. CC-YZS046 TaxID=3042152 RepID=UPI002D790B84|nr:hypothetical protein [Tsuneonella sp. CC-YZS046]WRO65397.1 hypothetical protein U8326_10020 [Tsuneonella sp. CC-YZS046]